MLAPTGNHTDYYNCKGWYSVLVQGTADQNYCFTDVNIGWPGSAHDARVLLNSCMQKANPGTLLPDSPHMLAREQVPSYLFGDSA